MHQSIWSIEVVCALYGAYSGAAIHFLQPRWSCVVMTIFLSCEHDITFVLSASDTGHPSYTPPRSPDNALTDADESLEYRKASKDGSLITKSPRAP